MRGALVALGIAALPLIVAGANAAESPYRPNGDCGGLPRVALTTPPGFCVGLVRADLAYPRGVLPLDDGRVVVVEMGNWSARRGAIVVLSPAASGFRRSVWVDGLDRPHGLALGPDGRIYAGEVGRVLRFAVPPGDARPKIEPVVSGLPGEGRHPLVAVVFDRSGDLYVNIGSASDNCEPIGAYPGARADRCPEAEGNAPRGAVRRYRMRWPAGEVTGEDVFARGLRNSLALAVHPRSGVLWQAENARDNLRGKLPGLADDENVPRDELNELAAGAHYGWPYCHDEVTPAPEFPQASCDSYRKPALLLPGHAAPLGMQFAHGLWPPPFAEGLVIAFHGYRRNGHRLMFYPFGANGRPTGQSVALIAGWTPGPGRVLGAPVDVKFDRAGRLYITEDRNGTLLRLERLR